MKKTIVISLVLVVLSVGCIQDQKESLGSSEEDSFNNLDSAIKEDLKSWKRVMDHCFKLVAEEPVRLEFEHLKEKGTLYHVDFRCKECDPDCGGGNCCPTKTAKYFEKDGKIYRIPRILSKQITFSDMFEDLETTEQVLEYWDFTDNKRFTTLDKARKGSHITNISKCKTDEKLKDLSQEVILKKEALLPF